MTFVTRYTPAPGEQALLKHIDGAGKVDGSCVVALPSPKGKSFEGFGGGLTFWDGKESIIHDKEEEKKEREERKDGKATNIVTFSKNKDNQIDNNAVEAKKETITTKRNRFRPREIHYDTRAGDLTFIDRAVWHQADPITKVCLQSYKFLHFRCHYIVFCFRISSNVDFVLSLSPSTSSPKGNSMGLGYILQSYVR